MSMSRGSFAGRHFGLGHRTTGSDQQNETYKILHLHYPHFGLVPKNEIFRRGQPFTPE